MLNLTNYYEYDPAEEFSKSRLRKELLAHLRDTPEGIHTREFHGVYQQLLVCLYMLF